MKLKNKKIQLLFILILCMGACDNNPYFEFEGENRIYFEFPIGNFGDEIDSLYLSIFDVPVTQESFDVWIKVRVTGNSPSTDLKYRITVDDKNSTAIEGIDYATLDREQVFKKGSGIDSIKITIDMAQAKGAEKKSIFINLEDSDELKIGFTEYKSFKFYYTAFRPEPDKWYVVQNILKDYHYMKYEKYIEYAGTDVFGSNSIVIYYATKVAKFFNDNIIISPITGERIVCE